MNYLKIDMNVNKNKKITKQFLLYILFLFFSNCLLSQFNKINTTEVLALGETECIPPQRWKENLLQSILKNSNVNFLLCDSIFFSIVVLNNGNPILDKIKLINYPHNDPYKIINVLSNIISKSNPWKPATKGCFTPPKKLKCYREYLLDLKNAKIYELMKSYFLKHGNPSLINYEKSAFKPNEILAFLPPSIATQDSAIYKMLPKCLDSLKTKNDSTTTIFFHVDKRYKINLVPVNSTATIDKEKLENELNKIYYPYGVSVSLNVLNKIEEKSWDINNDGKLNTGDGEFLSRYTDEMSALNYILKTRTDFDKEAIYLFVLDAATGSNTKGDMPIKSQFGYIFKPTSQVISHEIAHGFFQLKHTFDDGIALPKSSTNNLMDYNDGDKLYKFQWDLVHDKGLKLFSFMQDSAGRKLETDGHYGTVYLLSLILGMDKEKAKTLAEYTEKPDHFISSQNEISTVNGTYMSKEGQLNDHALTGGYQLDEIKKTVDAINLTPLNNLQEIGRLLHRLGDCYAHTDIEDMDKDIRMRKMYGNSGPYRTFAHSFAFSFSYGELKNFFRLKNKPDLIFMRPVWFRDYLLNLYVVLNNKFKLNKNIIDIKVFDKMIAFAVNEKCSLIGIIDYEISKILNKNSFYLYVYPEKDSDGIKEHNEYINKTIKYIKEDNKNVMLKTSEIKFFEKYNDSYIGTLYFEKTEKIGTLFIIK